MKKSLLIGLVIATTLFQGSAYSQEVEMDLPINDDSAPVVLSQPAPALQVPHSLAAPSANPAPVVAPAPVKINDPYVAGAEVYALSGDRENQAAHILSVAADGSYVLQFETDGAVGSSWSKASLAIASGCSNGLCVGDHVCATDGPRNDQTAAVVAIQSDGNYVLKFDTDGAIGDKWDLNSLATFH